VRSWKATDAECRAAWPGDELVGESAFESTHAITIKAPPRLVWPWLFQLGQDRGGFYSYTFLENLFGCRMRNADHIVASFQNRTIGDSVWMAPPERYGGAARMVIARVDRQKALVLVSADNPNLTVAGVHKNTWAFYLEPTESGETRLIARARARSKPELFWAVAHFIMERKMLLTVKYCAEQSSVQSHAA
jgi:hypothetical protein